MQDTQDTINSETSQSDMASEAYLRQLKATFEQLKYHGFADLRQSDDPNSHN